MKFLRNYSIASLACIAVAAVVIVGSYREVLIKAVTSIAENNVSAMARNALTPIRGHLVSYLDGASAPNVDPKAVAMPNELEQAIADMMHDSRVVKIKLYNRSGVVVFSTSPLQIGEHQESNEGWKSAIDGRAVAKLVYRDTFNSFDKVTEDDNLVQTYLPVRLRPTDPVAGVFEMYADVNSLVLEAESSELRLLAVTALILTLLYAVLLLLVHRSHELIASQKKTIEEKSAQLELLFRESARREDGERKKFANELNEGIAQTLSAVKLAVESAGESTGEGSRREGFDVLKLVLPDLQDAIGQVRSMAMDLRPPSLDELGLRRTLDTLCRDFEGANPGIRVEREITARESDIAPPLKIVVYRVAEAALKIIGRHPDATLIRLSLKADHLGLRLTIEDDASAVVSAMVESDLGEPRSPFLAVRERMLASGGKLSILKDASGKRAVSATWSL